ncbi:transposase, partial [Pseudomonas viridiflava]
VQADDIVEFGKRHRVFRGTPVRRVKVQLETWENPLTLVTNDLTRSAEEIADLYKERWQIELFFKWIKQHLKLKRFYAFSENAVKLQIYSAIITYVLLHIFQKRSNFCGSLFDLTRSLVC